MAMHAATKPVYPDFPDGDGNPMPERESHQRLVGDLRFGFEQVLQSLPRVHVGGNTFVYYNPERQQDNVAPDIYVALDVPRRHREKYQTWDEGKFPDLIVEILSPDTRKEDLTAKKDLYAQLGAREYLVFDPRPEIRRRTFEAFRLVNGVYLPIPREYTGGVYLTVLGAEVRVIDHWLRVMDPVTREPLPTPAEMADLRRAAEKRAAQEEQARREAEERAAHALGAQRLAEEHAARAVEEKRLAEERMARMEGELARLRARDTAQGPENGRQG